MNRVVLDEPRPSWSLAGTQLPGQWRHEFTKEEIDALKGVKDPYMLIGVDWARSPKLRPGFRYVPRRGHIEMSTSDGLHLLLLVKAAYG